MTDEYMVNALRALEQSVPPPIGEGKFPAKIDDINIRLSKNGQLELVFEMTIHDGDNKATIEKKSKLSENGLPYIEKELDVLKCEARPLDTLPNRIKKLIGSYVSVSRKMKEHDDAVYYNTYITGLIARPGSAVPGKEKVDMPESETPF